MVVRHAQWSSLRRAQLALIALVLWNGLGSTTLRVCGLKEGHCEWLATAQLRPGHLIRASIWTQGDVSYAAYSSLYTVYGPEMSESAPTPLVLRGDLWDQNTIQHTLVRVAAVTLSQRLLTWLGVSATVAPLGLLVLLTWLQHRKQHKSR